MIITQYVYLILSFIRIYPARLAAFNRAISIVRGKKKKPICRAQSDCRQSFASSSGEAEGALLPKWEVRGQKNRKSMYVLTAFHTSRQRANATC